MNDNTTDAEHIQNALQKFPSLTSADLRVYAAILERPESSRAELAAVTGLHASTVSAARSKLKLCAKSGQIFLPNTVAMSPDSDVSISQTHDHDVSEMNKNVNYDEIHSLLDFLDEPSRTRIARLQHMTVTYAQEAHDFFQTHINDDYIENVPGYLYTIINKNDPIPTQTPSGGSANRGETAKIADESLLKLIRAVDEKFRRTQPKKWVQAAKKLSLARQVVTAAAEDGRLESWRNELDWSDEQIIAMLTNLMTSEVN